jgi:hypothetical protein
MASPTHRRRLQRDSTAACAAAGVCGSTDLGRRRENLAADPQGRPATGMALAPSDDRDGIRDSDEIKHKPESMTSHGSGVAAGGTLRLAPSR